jgi:hypothetical protein
VFSAARVARDPWRLTQACHTRTAGSEAVRCWLQNPLWLHVLNLERSTPSTSASVTSATAQTSADNRMCLGRGTDQGMRCAEGSHNKPGKHTGISTRAHRSAKH